MTPLAILYGIGIVTSLITVGIVSSDDAEDTDILAGMLIALLWPALVVVMLGAVTRVAIEAVVRR